MAPTSVAAATMAAAAITLDITTTTTPATAHWLTEAPCWVSHLFWIVENQVYFDDVKLQVLLGR